MVRELAGKIALVTGAAAPNGIGRATCLRLARDGAFIVATDMGGAMTLADGPRDRAGLLDEVIAAIADAGGQGMAHELDVTDASSIAACLKAVRGAAGPVDILVNNAGSLAGAGPFLDGKAEDWRTSFEVNILGPMRLSQAVIPDMRAAGGGAIVNIGSIGGLGGRAAFGAYSAMKHAVTGLTKTIAVEFGPDGIRCNAVCPGYIATDMHAASNRRLAEAEGLSLDEMKARRYEAVALRDAGSPEDVAEAVAYLAGPRAAYVTGVNLPVTGGLSPGI
ncbi:SDR family oxidoreductase [Roseovarius spongiae]|uniref:SDR family oxidoreductase n=1 Tax=Roseovarius spongiae TaxID=2320272 RepID=A0A3A8B5U2_9RHOB|nr:SDR family oxidoreductase [Roseovarius spongiae]RKF15376.1 SDR family oxidoreductase [Roseovarius spongiae]